MWIHGTAQHQPLTSPQTCARPRRLTWPRWRRGGTSQPSRPLCGPEHQRSVYNNEIIIAYLSTALFICSPSPHHSHPPASSSHGGLEHHGVLELLGKGHGLLRVGDGLVGSGDHSDSASNSSASGAAWAGMGVGVRMDGGTRQVNESSPIPPPSSHTSHTPHLAAVLSPMASMVSGRGPTKVMPASAHLRAKVAFSERKPYLWGAEGWRTGVSRGHGSHGSHYHYSLGSWIPRNA